MGGDVYRVTVIGQLRKKLEHSKQSVSCLNEHIVRLHRAKMSVEGDGTKATWSIWPLHHSGTRTPLSSAPTALTQATASNMASDPSQAVVNDETATAILRQKKS